MDDFDYDEGSDLDNWESEQVFQDQCAEREDAFEGEACEVCSEDEGRETKLGFLCEECFAENAHAAQEARYDCR